MKPLFLLCLIIGALLSNNAIAQDTIYWKPATKLQWQDFEGKPDIASKFSAATSSGIVWSYAYKSGVFSFSVKTYFAKKRSWKRGVLTSRMLQHEQGHFDITEIFARKLVQTVNAMNKDRPYFEREIATVAANILIEKNTQQQQYDTQTNYGANYMAQQSWLRKIERELAAAKAF